MQNIFTTSFALDDQQDKYKNFENFWSSKNNSNNFLSLFWFDIAIVYAFFNLGSLGIHQNPAFLDWSWVLFQQQLFSYLKISQYLEAMINHWINHSILERQESKSSEKRLENNSDSVILLFISYNLLVSKIMIWVKRRKTEQQGQPNRVWGDSKRC